MIYTNNSNHYDDHASEFEPCGLIKFSARRRHRVDRIIEIAERHFIKHGFERTSMSAIATELGGSKSTLWSYFPSKSDMLCAVIKRSTSNCLNEIHQRIRDLTLDEAAIAGIVRIIVLTFCDNNFVYFIKIMMGANHIREDNNLFIVSELYRQSKVIINSAIAMNSSLGMMQNIVCPDIGEAIIRLVTGGLHYNILLGLETYSEKNVEEEIYSINATLLNAYPFLQSKPLCP